ncbi:MAG: hypothetical protein FE78DRAFT_152577 [Acidomyces sp. 'richmondensis']|nr:MAG: hypothetical protein FE78DRAFT_152577 [Acidomyces sp. 'richmondensis']
MGRSSKQEAGSEGDIQANLKAYHEIKSVCAAANAFSVPCSPLRAHIAGRTSRVQGY